MASGVSLQPAHLNRGEGSRAVVASVGRRLRTGGEAEAPGQAEKCLQLGSRHCWIRTLRGDALSDHPLPPPILAAAPSSQGTCRQTDSTVLGPLQMSRCVGETMRGTEQALGQHSMEQRGPPDREPGSCSHAGPCKWPLTVKEPKVQRLGICSGSGARTEGAPVLPGIFFCPQF